jgi:single-stranded-DNA-specific exonuclease
MAPQEAAEPAFLNVERSLTGRRWRVRESDAGLIEAFRRNHALPEIAARLMAARGVTRDSAENFLNPTLKAFFPNPSTFVDRDSAASAIEDAIDAGRQCAVLADYDVDGATSGAQLVR